MSPIAAVQPESVRAVIGRSGERLWGELTRESRHGVTVEYATTFLVGSGKADPVADRAGRIEGMRMRDPLVSEWCSESCWHDENAARKRAQAFDRERCFAECIRREVRVR